MSERIRANVFDDGSKASKLLQSDLKDRGLEINSVKVDPTDTIQEWFTKINGEDKTYVHFTFEEYIADHEKLRKELDKVERLGFKNRIVREYEGLDDKTMEYRYNLIVPSPEQKKFHVGKDEDVHEILKDSGEVKIPTKWVPQRKVDPDDEMKSMDKPYITHHVNYDSSKREEADETKNKSTARKVRKLFKK